MMYRLATVLWLLFLSWSVSAVAGQEADEDQRPITPRYMLMDTQGNAVSSRSFPGRFQLIAFGYTFCPDICPTTLSEMSLVMKQLGELSALLQPIFVTVDPERDTPATLARYTAFFHPEIIGLTGQPELIRRAADTFKVRYERHTIPGGDPRHYTMDHSAGMYMLGPDGEFVAKFAYATPVSEITARIRPILESASARQGR